MTLRDYTANVISASKVVPDGNFKDSKASGVWDINEALDLIKGGNWPNAANFNPAAFVDGLFQTTVWDGSGSARSITNDIDLSTKEGLVWIKKRSGSANYTLQDTVRGATKHIRSSGDSSESTEAQTITAFNSNGFSLGTDDLVNASSSEYVGWTFRKQPKFFDIVTYTGNGTAGRTVSHNLGVVPGMMMIKRLNSGTDWSVYHRSVDSSSPENYYLKLNGTNARIDNDGQFNDTAPTATEFTLGAGSNTNASGGTYVAYLFAHNNNDGGFGEPGDQDIIKCGSLTTDSNGLATVNLGFEPQWLMIKRTTTTGDWQIVDNLRGFVNNSSGGDAVLKPNSSDAESSFTHSTPTATGFLIDGNVSNHTIIYMAIRRGGMQTPSTASDVFAIDQENSSAPYYTSNFPVDMGFVRRKDNTSSWYIYDRLRQGRELVIDTTAAEGVAGNAQFDYMDGFTSGAFASDVFAWMWKRARGYFDVVTWNVDGTGDQTINHNLGVAPEMIWSKNRDDSGSGSGDWWIGHTGLTGWDSANENNRHALKFTTGASAQQGYHKDFTSTSIRLLGNAAGGYNTSHQSIAYLFATVEGVSKVGSFSGNSGTQTIDCGFSGGTGARFLLIKAYSTTGGWFVWDSARGIVSGNDPYLLLHSSVAEETGYDAIDTHSSGFTLNNVGAGTNDSGTNYIFYAIA
jgi:hypothetical protein